MNHHVWPGLAQAPDRGGGWIVLDEVNLRLNDIVDLQQDYLMSILGGNRSRWPSIKVAETFSRMVTRRDVKARLIRPDGQAASPLAVFASLSTASSAPWSCGEKL